jgi:hypothetical protein
MTFKPPGHYEARDCAVQPIQTDPTLRVNSLRRRPGVWFIPRLCAQMRQSSTEILAVCPPYLMGHRPLRELFELRGGGYSPLACA